MIRDGAMWLGRELLITVADARCMQCVDADFRKLTLGTSPDNCPFSFHSAFFSSSFFFLSFLLTFSIMQFPLFPFPFLFFLLIRDPVMGSWRRGTKVDFILYSCNNRQWPTSFWPWEWAVTGHLCMHDHRAYFEMWKVGRRLPIAETLFNLCRCFFHMVRFSHFVIFFQSSASPNSSGISLSLIHIWRCRRIERCRSRWSPYH